MPGYHIPVQKKYQDLDLPSGGTVQVRLLGVDDLVEMGMLEKFDIFGSIVQTEHVDRVKGKRPQDRKPKKLTKAQQAAAENDAITDAFKDPAKFKAMMEMMDQLCARCIVQPEVRLAYKAESILIEEGGVQIRLVPHNDQDAQNRDQNAIWTDMLDLSDKMAVFGVVMPGQEKMASFREGPKPGLGDMDHVSEDAVPSE